MSSSDVLYQHWRRQTIDGKGNVKAVTLGTMVVNVSGGGKHKEVDVTVIA